MKLTDLNALNKARSSGKSALLYSDVDSGAQTLTIEDDGSGEIELTPEMLQGPGRRAARTAAGWSRPTDGASSSRSSIRRAG